MKATTHKNTSITIAAFFTLLLLGSFPVMAQQSAAYVGVDQGKWFSSVSTDKARYSPLEPAEFKVAFRQPANGKTLVIAYEHLDSLVGSDTLTVQNADSISWNWQVPGIDYRGYIAGIFLYDSGTLLDYTDIGLDVSSNWSKFPRYGFLSSYQSLPQEEIDSTISVLNRYHINGLQFYDWQYEHNQPLAGTVQDPSPSWNDIANRTNYLSTVEGYIEAAHQKGMKAMNYNLLYGAYGNADQDGASDSWRLFQDPNHQSPEFYQLPSGWASNLYVMDPGNQDWRDYIFAQERKAYLAIPFDGWHVDQLGYLGQVWNYAGQPVNLTDTFASFLSQAKSQLNVDLVMNAVEQYGQQQIAQAPVDFLYTEVWDPDSTYGDLVKIISDNSTYSQNRLSTVLAAYMDYNLSSGYFNTPGVLFTDAVIFAAGGDHLELGEHMLSNEYFPSAKLSMTDTLSSDLVYYYDFMVGYENLLRDKETVVSLPLSAEIGSISLALSPQPTRRSVWSQVTTKSNLVILNLVNFTNANSMAWRDRYGTQTYPDTLSEIRFIFSETTRIRNIWTASPDFYGGSPVSIPFMQSGNTVSFTLPSLLYWSMVVVQLDTTITSVNGGQNGLPKSFSLEQNFPNPFNPATEIDYRLAAAGHVTLKVYDVLGRTVATLVDGREEAGGYSATFNAGGLPSGVYFYRLIDGSYSRIRKMLLLK